MKEKPLQRVEIRVFSLRDLGRVEFDRFGKSEDVIQAMICGISGDDEGKQIMSDEGFHCERRGIPGEEAMIRGILGEEAMIRGDDTSDEGFNLTDLGKVRDLGLGFKFDIFGKSEGGREGNQKKFPPLTHICKFFFFSSYFFGRR